MNYNIALRDELDAEGQHTLVYVDRADKDDKSFGYTTIAIVAVDQWNEKAGKNIKRIVSETHHINYDRTGAREI